MPYVRKRTVRRRAPLRRTKNTRKRTYPRRTQRPRARRGPTKGLRPKWENPISQGKLVKFKFADNGYTDSTSLVGNYQTSHVFAGNGCYDPDLGTIGVQPYGWDQYDAFYDRYIVHASKIKLSYNIDEAYKNLKVYVIPQNITPLTYRDPSDLKMMPGVRYKESTWQVLGSKKSVIYNYMSTRRMKKEMNLKDNTLSAQTNANPTNQWFWQVYFDSSTTAEALSITYDIEITYYVTLSKVDSVNES